MFKVELKIGDHWCGNLKICRYRRLHGDTLVYVSTVVDDKHSTPPYEKVFVEHSLSDGGFVLAQKCLEAHQNGGIPEPDPVPYKTCGACGNTEDLMGCQYTYDSPHHYDGVSEWHCKCGARTGRWSGCVLGAGEPEWRFGT